MAELTEEMLEVRSKLMMAPLDVLKGILEEFGESVDTSKGRLVVAMQADRFFMKEMESDQSATTLLSVKHTLADTAPKGLETTLSTSALKTETESMKDTKPFVRSQEEVKKENHAAVKLHKDFKISGQIDCKAGISYTSLIRQIETGKQKGYSEVDIIDGVIKAVVPSSSLRSYLDGRPDINLATLRSIRRGHYAEKNATELYSELASATQNPKENPNDFLLRVMDLRNRILFASQEDSNELKYSPELVAGLFRRTVYTGLRDTTLRHEMRKHLDNVAISDAGLMHELNQIIIQESERQSKLQSKHSVSQISCTSLEINSVKEAVKNDLASEIKSLRLEMTKLKELVGCSQSDVRAKPTNSRSRPGCDVCQSTGKHCDHCWTCGGSGHRRQHCPNKKPHPSGNRSGSS